MEGDVGSRPLAVPWCVGSALLGSSRAGGRQLLLLFLLVLSLRCASPKWGNTLKQGFGQAHAWSQGLLFNPAAQDWAEK